MSVVSGWTNAPDLFDLNELEKGNRARLEAFIAGLDKPVDLPFAVGALVTPITDESNGPPTGVVLAVTRCSFAQSKWWISTSWSHTGNQYPACNYREVGNG